MVIHVVVPVMLVFHNGVVSERTDVGVKTKPNANAVMPVNPVPHTMAVLVDFGVVKP